MIKVVLVEDDEVLRKGLAEYLRLSDIAVSEVATGIELYRALRTDRFDVAVLDVNLPDTTGFDLARDLRSDGSMGIIMLTARTARSDRLQAYEVGADIFLSKPADGAELVLAIRNLAARVGGQQPTPIAGAHEETWQLRSQQGRLVDPQSRFIGLTTREVLFLELLADAGGELVNRGELERILGYTARETVSRGLDALVRRLRAKAKAAGMDLPVQTIRSVGLRVTKPLTKN